MKQSNLAAKSPFTAAQELQNCKCDLHFKTGSFRVILHLTFGILFRKKSVTKYLYHKLKFCVSLLRRRPMQIFGFSSNLTCAAHILEVNVAAIEATTPPSMSLQISQIVRCRRCLNMFCPNIAKYCYSPRNIPLCTPIYLCPLLTGVRV